MQVLKKELWSCTWAQSKSSFCPEVTLHLFGLMCLLFCMRRKMSNLSESVFVCLCLLVTVGLCFCLFLTHCNVCVQKSAIRHVCHAPVLIQCIWVKSGRVYKKTRNPGHSSKFMQLVQMHPPQ